MNDISKNLFDYGTLKTNENGQFSFSQKVKGFDSDQLISQMNILKDKEIKKYQDEISVLEEKKIPKLKELEEKIQNINQKLSLFSDFNQFKNDEDNNLFNRLYLELNASNGNDALNYAQFELIQNNAKENQSYSLVIEKIAKQGVVNSGLIEESIDSELNITDVLSLNTYQEDEYANPIFEEIAIDYTDSVRSIAKKINDSNFFSASVLEDLNGVYLSIAHKETGLPVEYMSNYLTEILQLPYEPLDISSNQNLEAKFILNGITFESKSNTITNLENSGIKINLLNADPSNQITLATKQRKAELKEGIIDFIKEINSTFYFLETQEQYTMADNIITPSEGSYLFGQKIIKEFKQKFNEIISSKLFSDNNLKTLDAIGLKIQFKKNSNEILGVENLENILSSGVTLDESKLNAAIDNNFLELKKLLSETYQATDNMKVVHLPNKVDYGQYEVSIIDSENATLKDSNNKEYSCKINNNFIIGENELEGMLIHLQNQDVNQFSFTFEKGIFSRYKDHFNFILKEKNNNSKNMHNPFLRTTEVFETQNSKLKKKVTETENKYTQKIKQINKKLDSFYNQYIKIEQNSRSLTSFLSSLNKDNK